MTPDALQSALQTLPDCELRRCARKALEMRQGVEDVPARLRDIDLCIFRTFGVRDIPAEYLEDDYAAAMALLDLVCEVQSAVRRDLFRRFGLRCITGPVGEPYEERSPRYAAAKARPTGDPALDWHVADTAACGYEWDGTPAVLMPARVDVYRYDEAADDEALRRPEPAAEEPLETAIMPTVEGGAADALELPTSLTLTLPDGTEHRFNGPLRLRIEGGQR